jgi:hypothetical protein
MVANGRFSAGTALKSEAFDFLSNLSTLWAMVLGALLATLGGFVTSQLEWYLERRRRHRHAALFFGEILSTLGAILQIAHDTHGRGDPFGPVTLRMLRGARSEIDIYTRNRETLYDIHDADLRARIHTLILRVIGPLEGLFDAADEIRTLDAELLKPDMHASHRAELEARRERLAGNRQGSYEFLMENAEPIAPLVEELGVVAARQIGTAASLGRGVTG